MMNKHTPASRFIDIRKLDRETRKFLYLGFAVAVVIHTIAGVWLHYGVEYDRISDKKETVASIPVRIVLRTFPSRFSIMRPRPGRSPSRKAYSIKKSLQAIPPAIPGKTTLPAFGDRESIDPVDIDGDNFVQAPPERDYYVFDDLGLIDDGIKRYDENHIRLTDEMIDIDELDTGRFKGLVVADPNNKRNVRGYLYIPSGIIVGGEQPEISQQALTDLRDFVMRRYTGIEIKLDAELELGSREIFKYPFLYITSSVPFELKPHEAKNFREYIENGGFALLEPTGLPDDEDPSGMSVATASMRDMVRDTIGNSARFVQLSKEHELFHCFFDIDIENGYNKYPIRDYGSWWKQPLYCLEGVFIGERLALVYSEKGYGYGWSGEGLESAYHFGVNCIVYALNQYGGTAVRLVDVSTSTYQESQRQWETNPREQYRNSVRQPFASQRRRR